MLALGGRNDTFVYADRKVTCRARRLRAPA